MSVSERQIHNIFAHIVLLLRKKIILESISLFFSIEASFSNQWNFGQSARNAIQQNGQKSNFIRLYKQFFLASAIIE